LARDFYVFDLTHAVIRARKTLQPKKDKNFPDDDPIAAA